MSRKPSSAKRPRKSRVSRLHKCTPWKAVYTQHAILPGWTIKMDDDIQFPVAVVPETIGGIKVDGRSPLQEAIARFIVATPDLYSACTHTLKTLAGEPTVKDLADVLSMLRKAIRKANAKGGAR